MTIRESLLALSAYPIPMWTIEAISLKRVVALDSEYSLSTSTDSGYRLATADIYKWLYFAPNVAQGGQSYSFTDEQRSLYKKLAMAVYSELGDSELGSLKGNYGYMGTRL